MKKRKTFLTLMLVIALVGTMVAGPLVKRAEAGALNDSYLYLERINTGIASGLDMVLALNPSQAFASGATITLRFPGSSADWCKTAGVIEVVGVAAADPDDGASKDIDAVLPGTLTAACAQGSGDTITISGLTGLSGGTMYGVSITDGAGAGVLGTPAAGGNILVSITITQGANSDSSTYGVYLVSDDTVTITADVAAAPTVTCTLAGTTVNLGTLYAGGAYSTNAGTTSVQTATSNNGDGYYWAVYGANGGLYKSTVTQDTLAAPATTVNLATTEGFGLRITDAASDTYVQANYKNGTSSTFGGYGIGFTNAALAISHVVTNTDITTETHNVIWGAKADAGAQTGAYTEDVTFICGGYY